MMDRRSFLTLTSATLISIPVAANASAADDRWDGNWWTGLNAATKFGYVLGYAEGSEKADATWAYGQCKTLVSEKYAAAVSKGNDYSGITFGQLITGIDEFYKDFRNTRIRAADAMMVVKQQISGFNQKEIDETLQTLRQAALDPRY